MDSISIIKIWYSSKLVGNQPDRKEIVSEKDHKIELGQFGDSESLGFKPRYFFSYSQGTSILNDFLVTTFRSKGPT